MIYLCCDDEPRRVKVQAHPTLNGIDFLEVSDNPGDPIARRQRRLQVHFLKDLTPGVLTEDNVSIEGGERIKNIVVTRVTIGAQGSPPSSPPTSQPNVLTVEVSGRGDFSTYTLRLIQGAGNNAAPKGFDPILSAVDFSFKASCPSDFDCQPQRVCPPEPVTAPEIDYLAKDYASFRRLLLDRLALVAPQWTERNTADAGIALVELLAYVGDYLSYQQDAVGTESYLGTARRRTSVRRHARLVDYPMHDGRNARAWVHIAAGPGGDGLTLQKGAGRDSTKLLTSIPGRLPPLIPQNSRAFDLALLARPQVFELLHDITLFSAHNLIKFYTWESRDCCLPKGATQATLRDDALNRLRLRAGDVLIFEERKGPQTGVDADADPTHRHAVLLTRVSPQAEIDTVDGQPRRTPGDPINDPLTDTPIVEIEWSTADALPFALCVSAEIDNQLADDISAALGNVVLADHGQTFADELSDSVTASGSLLPEIVPQPNAALAVSAAGNDRCNSVPAAVPTARYRPQLRQSPLTHAVPFDPANPPLSAASATNFGADDPLAIPLPSIQLLSALEHEQTKWSPVRDLLASGSNTKEFVVEVEVDGTPYLRFGDGVLGSRPVSGTRFAATYRVGNGAAGNVGADTLVHLVSATLTDATAIVRVRNPLRAGGGIEPETIEEVRQNAPSAFRVQQRAVTPADYEEITTRPELAAHCNLDVQRAAATRRWTGSWYTNFITVDRLGGRDVNAAFEQSLRNCLERFRMAGQDLEVDGPQYVSLELTIAVCIKPGYFFSDIEQALLDVFSNRRLPDGRRGFFHPDNLTFGQAVYVSSLIATAQTVPGVDSVSITRFQRQRIDSDEALKSGQLTLGRLEIARLDNDPNFPERGSFTVTNG